MLTKNEVKDLTRQIIARYVEDILEMLASLSKPTRSRAESTSQSKSMSCDPAPTPAEKCIDKTRTSFRPSRGLLATLCQASRFFFAGKPKSACPKGGQHESGGRRASRMRTYGRLLPSLRHHRRNEPPPRRRGPEKARNRRCVAPRRTPSRASELTDEVPFS